MKNAPTTKSSESAKDQGHCTVPDRFQGTTNPRHLRALKELMALPTRRKALDSKVGCINGPELVAELRRRGLELPCQRIEVIDRDGVVCRPGIYSLTRRDRRLINAWLARSGVTL